MNELNYIYFSKQSNSSYSRSIAYKAIRDYTSKVTPQYISEDAYKLLGCKPTSYTDMKRNSNSSKCIWEHTMPVNTIFKNIIDHDMNLNEIKSYLDSTIISIVTVEEDSELTNNGFRDYRENWIDAYTESNIKLIPYNHDSEFYKKFYDKYFIDNSQKFIDDSIVGCVLGSIDFIKIGKPSKYNTITSPQLKLIFERYTELTNKYTGVTPFQFTQEVKLDYPMKRNAENRYFDNIYFDLTDSVDIDDYINCFRDETLEKLI